MDTGTDMAGRCGYNSTGNGRRGGWRERGRQWSTEAEKAYVGGGGCRSTGDSTRGGVPIRFGTYNIPNGRNRGL